MNSDYVFYFKSRILILKRFIIDFLVPVKRHGFIESEAMIGDILYEARSNLLTAIDPDQTHLRAGKIANIKTCAKYLNGIYIENGDVFSFWRQVGRATIHRGFVEGREMRNGVLIPTIGGGICQLSSAIYQAAKHSNMEIVERHEHSRIVEGAAYPKGEDANLFWNYVDLRFRATQAVILKVEVAQDTLFVSLFSANRK